MDVLPAHFTIIRWCGAWIEREDSNSFIRVLNLFYRYTMVILVHHCTVFEIVDGVMSRDDLDDVIENLFLRLTLIGTCFKIVNFLVQEKQIRVLLNRFRSIACKSTTPAEQKILDKYNQAAKWYAIIYMTMAQLTSIALLIVPLFGLQNGERPLPFKMYLPYSVSDLLVYVATYLQQVVVMIYAAGIDIILDSLVYGFMILVCGQFDLLRHRLLQIFDNYESDDSNEKKAQRMILIKNCICHHLLIFDFVKSIQKIFGWTITTLFLYTLITLCTLIFRLSQVSIISVEFLSITMYLASMLFEVFCYCWLGNELELKSRDIVEAVYFTNWESTSTRERKNLLIIMTISEKSLKLSFHGIFTLSLDTFTWMIKTSYSAFNLLQQMTD